ncbi:hypothetical protein NC652_003468 [Populus alba x Populus x berolinensis]|nr:hypothetical protein NC652_003468 [Populus alba x Populus x berolinensis]
MANLNLLGSIRFAFVQLFKQKNPDRVWLSASIPGATATHIFEQARISLRVFLAALHTHRRLFLDVTIATSSITVIVTSCRRIKSIMSSLFRTLETQYL